jgi:hypothetical protein
MDAGRLRRFPNRFRQRLHPPGDEMREERIQAALANRDQRERIEAPLGGEEYAEDMVMAMDLSQAEIREPSLGHFLKNLKGLFNQWRVR